MPNQIQFTEGHKNLYTYNAGGKKLETVSYTVNNIVNVPIGTISTLPGNPSDYTKLITDYVGNIIYENGSLKQIMLPEGYWQNGVFYYYLKDHLGDTRIVINSSGTIIEKSHYYPSGMRFADTSTSNSSALPFRYNGKEMETMNGLNQMDYGARRRFSWGPRWTGPDDLREKYYSISPYVYCNNNPVNAFDPDGRLIVFVTYDVNGKSNNQLTYHNGNFWHENGARYNPQKESLSKSLYRLLTVYREIEKSGDRVLINQLETLENSENKHLIEEGNDGSYVKPFIKGKSKEDVEDMVDNGAHVGTRTAFDFSDEAKKDLSDNNKGIPFTDADQVTHEMQHQYDNDQGKNADSNGNGASNPAEIRGVNNENRERKLEKENKRTTYGGKNIDPNKLK